MSSEWDKCPMCSHVHAGDDCPTIEGQAARIAALEAENARLRAASDERALAMIESYRCPVCGYGAIVVADEGTACCAYCSLRAERDAAQLSVSWSDAEPWIAVHRVADGREVETVIVHLDTGECEVSRFTGPKGNRKSTGSDLPYPFPELLPTHGGIRASTLRRLGGWIMDNAEYRRLVICEGGGQLEGWDDAERHDLCVDDGLDAALNAALDAAGAPK